MTNIKVVAVTDTNWSTPEINEAGILPLANLPTKLYGFGLLRVEGYLEPIIAAFTYKDYDLLDTVVRAYNEQTGAFLGPITLEDLIKWPALVVKANMCLVLATLPNGMNPWNGTFFKLDRFETIIWLTARQYYTLVGDSTLLDLENDYPDFLELGGRSTKLLRNAKTVGAVNPIIETDIEVFTKAIATADYGNLTCLAMDVNYVAVVNYYNDIYVFSRTQVDYVINLSLQQGVTIYVALDDMKQEPGIVGVTGIKSLQALSSFKVLEVNRKVRTIRTSTLPEVERLVAEAQLISTTIREPIPTPDVKTKQLLKALDLANQHLFEQALPYEQLITLIDEELVLQLLHTGLLTQLDNLVSIN